jgi:tRNA (pseudouridine54-N1)-methyltransferase
MRHFVYFSESAQTSGKFNTDDLMKAGRMDIVIHFLINTFFVSHNIREDTKLHMVFYGMPDPPKHIEIQIKPGTPISKKDVAGLIKKILYKYREGEKTEVLPGCFIEKKSFLNVINDLISEGKKIFVLDKRGESIRDVEIPDNSVFVIGDHNGLPKKELKRLKQMATPVSVGPKMYFASHVATILNNELDLRGL